MLSEDPTGEPNATRSCVVIGASGGIGRAIASHLIARGDRVHAVARSPLDLRGAVLHQPMDLADGSSIERVAAAVGADGPVDMVIVATGMLQADRIVPEKTFRTMEPEALARLFAVNTIGPAIVAKHFLPLLRRDARSVFAALSARVGSIGDNRLGGWYGYRASKAALNQVLRTLAIEVARTRPNAIVLGLHPGTVATRLSQPFRGAKDEGVFEPDVAATYLLEVIARATPSQSGKVLDWAGKVIDP